MRLNDFVESLRQTIESAGIDGGVFSTGTGGHFREDDDDEDDEDNVPGSGVPELDGVNTFEDEGLLTRNKGLVVHMSNGDEFQITIVKSK